MIIIVVLECIHSIFTIKRKDIDMWNEEKTLKQREIEKQLSKLSVKEIETIEWVVNNPVFVKEVTCRTKMSEKEIDEHIVKAIEQEDFLKQILLVIAKENKRVQEEKERQRFRNRCQDDI